jgi:hypothetical protein
VPDTRRLLTAKIEGKRRPARPRKNGLEKMNKDTKSLVIKTVAAAGCGRRIVDARTPQEL